jgi:hypothetical protein
MPLPWNDGILECWNIGIRAEINHFNCKKLLQTHHSITPPFHYSNWGEAPKFILHHINFFSRPTIGLIIPEWTLGLVLDSPWAERDKPPDGSS